MVKTPKAVYAEKDEEQKQLYRAGQLFPVFHCKYATNPCTKPSAGFPFHPGLSAANQ